MTRKTRQTKKKIISDSDESPSEAEEVVLSKRTTRGRASRRTSAKAISSDSDSDKNEKENDKGKSDKEKSDDANSDKEDGPSEEPAPVVSASKTDEKSDEPEKIEDLDEDPKEAGETSKKTEKSSKKTKETSKESGESSKKTKESAKEAEKSVEEDENPEDSVEKMDTDDDSTSPKPEEKKTPEEAGISSTNGSLEDEKSEETEKDEGDDQEKPAADKENQVENAQEDEKPKIRLIPIEKLLKPDIIMKQANQDAKISTTTKSQANNRPSHSRSAVNNSRSKKNVSYIEISDSSEESTTSDEPELIDGSSDEEEKSKSSSGDEVIVKRTSSRRAQTRSSKSAKNENSTKTKEFDLDSIKSPTRVLREKGAIKSLSVNISKMPNNVNKLMKVYRINNQKGEGEGEDVLSSQTSNDLELDDIENMISTTKIERTKSADDSHPEEPDSQTSEEVTSTTGNKKGKQKSAGPSEKIKPPPEKPQKAAKNAKGKKEPEKKEEVRPTRRSGRANRAVAILDISSESSNGDSSDDEASSSTAVLKSRTRKTSQSNNTSKKEQEPIKPIKITRQMLQSPSKNTSSQSSSETEKTKKKDDEKESAVVTEESKEKPGNIKITIKLNKNSAKKKTSTESSSSEDEDVNLEARKKHNKKSPKKGKKVESSVSSTAESEEENKKPRSPRKKKSVDAEVIMPRQTRGSRRKEEEEKEEEEEEAVKEDGEEKSEQLVVEGPRNRTKISPLFRDLKAKFEAKKKKRSNSLESQETVSEKAKGCKDHEEKKSKNNKKDGSDEEGEKNVPAKSTRAGKNSNKAAAVEPAERATRGRGKSTKQVKDDDEENENSNENENVTEVNGDADSAKEIDPLNDDADDEEPTIIKKDKNLAKRKRVISSSESEGEGKAKKKRKMSSSEENEKEKESDNESKNESEEEEEENGKSDEESEKNERSDGSDGSEDEIKPKKKKRKAKASESDASVNSDDDDMLDADRPKAKRRKRIKKMGSSDEDGDKNDKSKGRKNIRKLIKKLDMTTKEAAKAERERKQRIEERQKMYNQVYDEKPEVIKELTSLVLDFDEKTKKPLLQVDKRLVKKLKPHQANGVKFMWDACFESLSRCKKEEGSGCILAHCMGLGKTLQVIALVHTLLMNSEKTKVFKVLVVCPLSTVLNWVNEFNIWLKDIDKSEDIYIYDITKLKQNVDRANRLMEWHNDGGVMIIGYEMFRNLTSETNRLRKKVRESLNCSLLDPGPDLIVCDEGHLLKNEKTSISKAMNKIQSLRRIVLTGTPLQNNLKEYYCMVQFVKPNLLGKYQEYMNRFVNPITNGQYTDSTQYDIQLMKRRAHVLHKMLDGCVQRRDYGVLTPFLPPKHEYVVSIKLTPMQIKLYKHYMENKSKSLDEGVQKRASVLFQDFQNLQRIWTAPRVLRYNSDKYELVQQKRRDNMDSEEESIGSIKDFIDDEDSDDSESGGTSSSGTESDDEGSIQSINSDEPLKKIKKKKKEVPVRRTRANADNFEPEPEPEIETRKENPTEWWMQICPEDELDNLEHSSKLLLLMAILEQCEAIGDKLLVFSQSLYSLDVIEHFLNLIDERTQQEHKVDEEGESSTAEKKDKTKFTGSWSLGLDYFRLDGSTPVEQRNASCKSFNHPDNHRARLFLISTRAGGLGINLVAANRVIIFDASWNPSHDIQSIFRVYRFGQTKPCYVYRFLALGTMEEKIYERQVMKQSISKRVIDEQQIDRHYNQNDLQELYRYDLEPDEERILPLLPKDRLFAELLKKYENLIFKYHEHDTLLENKEEETLNEEERKMAWEEFEQEKNRPQYVSYVPQTTRGIGPVTSNNIFGIRTDVLLKLLSIKARMDNPTINEFQVKQVIPLLMQELYRQMGNGEMTLYSQLIALSSSLEVPNKFGSAIGVTNGGATPATVRPQPTGQASTSMNNYYKQQMLQRKIAEQQQRYTQMKRPPPTINGPVIEIDD